MGVIREDFKMSTPGVGLAHGLVLQKNFRTTSLGEHWRVLSEDRCVLAGTWTVSDEHEGIVFHFCCEACLTGLTYRLVEKDLVAWCKRCFTAKSAPTRPRIVHRYVAIDRHHLTVAFEEVLAEAGLDPLTAFVVSSHLVDLVPKGIR